MRIRNKSLIILVNRVITAVFPIVMAIILVRMVDKTTFGLYRQVTSICVFLSTIFCLNLPNTMYYFFPKIPADEHRSFAVQTLIQGVLLGSCVSAVMWFGGDFIANKIANDPALADPLKAYSLFGIGYIIFLIVPAALISKDRVVQAGIFKIAHVAVRAGVIVTAFAVGFSLVKVMWSVAFMGIISAGIGILVLISNTPPSSIKIKFRSVSEQMQYALPLAAGGLAGIVSKQLDKWVVMYFFTSEQFGTYSLGAIQIPIVFFITSSLTHAMMPSLVQMYDSGQAKGALSLWHKGIRKSALILFPAYIYLLILSFDIIIFLFGKEYLDAVGPFIVYLTLLPMRIAVYGTLLRAAGNTFPVFVAAFLGVIVNIVLSIGLVLSFKGTYIAFIAPAIATIIAVFVIALYQLIYVKKMLRVKFREVFPWRNLGIAMMISVVSAVIFIPLKMTVSSAILRIILGFFIYSVCFTALMIKLNLLEEDERKLVFLPFNYIRTKIRR